MGGIEAFVLSDIDSGRIELEDDASTSAMKKKMRPYALVDDEVAKGNEVLFVRMDTTGKRVIGSCTLLRVVISRAIIMWSCWSDRGN